MSETRMTVEDSRKATDIILGLVDQVYGLRMKDITRERITAYFDDKPEMENLKTAIFSFFRALGSLDLE